MNRWPIIAAPLAAAALAALAATAVPGFAQENSPPSVTGDDYRDLLENSPFTRSLNLSDTLSLTGVANIGDESIITLIDSKTNESYVVSGADANAQGWKLVEVSPGRGLEGMTAKIAIAGGEMVTVRFDEKQLNPKPRKPAAGVRIPKGPDKRPRPTDEERRKFGEWIRHRMGKMNEEQRRRVGQLMKEKMQANPNLSDRQKGEIFAQIVEHVAKGGK